MCPQCQDPGVLARGSKGSWISLDLQVSGLFWASWGPCLGTLFWRGGAFKGSLSHLMGHLKGLLKGFLKIFPRSIKAPRGHTVPHGHTLPGTLGDTCMPFRIPGGTLNPRCPL